MSRPVAAVVLLQRAQARRRAEGSWASSVSGVRLAQVKPPGQRNFASPGAERPEEDPQKQNLSSVFRPSWPGRRVVMKSGVRDGGVRAAGPPSGLRKPAHLKAVRRDADEFVGVPGETPPTRRLLESCGIGTGVDVERPDSEARGAPPYPLVAVAAGPLALPLRHGRPRGARSWSRRGDRPGVPRRTSIRRPSGVGDAGRPGGSGRHPSGPTAPKERPVGSGGQPARPADR